MEVFKQCNIDCNFLICYRIASLWLLFNSGQKRWHDFHFTSSYLLPLSQCWLPTKIILKEISLKHTTLKWWRGHSKSMLYALKTVILKVLNWSDVKYYPLLWAFLLLLGEDCRLQNSAFLLSLKLLRGHKMRGWVREPLELNKIDLTWLEIVSAKSGFYNLCLFVHSFQD